MPHADAPASNGHPAPRAAFDAVVIAASLGGRPVLEQVLALLPADFPAPLLVVQHLDPRSRCLLPTLLAPRTRLAVTQAESGAPLRPGTVYVAPPGWHLLVAPGRLCLLSGGPRVSFARPSADLLFMSAAETFGDRTLGVVLSGSLFDGAEGAVAIRRAGGVVLAQEPGTCRAPGMPRAAIEKGAVNLALPTPALAAAVLGLVAVPGVPALFGFGARVAA